MGEVFGRFFDRLRNLVPARTMALYVTLTGFYPMAWKASTEVPEWIPFVVILLCLTFQVIAGIVEKKKAWAIVMAGGTFILFGITQPYYGILGVFEVSGVVNVVFAMVAVVYVTILSAVCTELLKASSEL